jgi:Mitochondrial carrier protein
MNLFQGIRGLFRGLMPTVIGILPYSGIAFALNEQGKRKVRGMVVLHIYSGFVEADLVLARCYTMNNPLFPILI